MALTLTSAVIPIGGTSLVLGFSSDVEGGDELDNPAGLCSLVVTIVGRTAPNVVSATLPVGNQPMSVNNFFDSVIFTSDVMTVTIIGETCLTDFNGEHPADVTNFPVVNNSLIVNTTISNLPEQCAVMMTTCDGQGNPQSGVGITFTLEYPPANPVTGLSFSTDPFTVVSGEGGALSVPLWRTATYLVQRGAGQPVRVIVPDASSYSPVLILGLDNL